MQNDLLLNSLIPCIRVQCMFANPILYLNNIFYHYQTIHLVHEKQQTCEQNYIQPASAIQVSKLYSSCDRGHHSHKRCQNLNHHMQAN